MDTDLKWIKKHYGEKMMHLCRSLFPRILEKQGMLPTILEKNFAYNKFLADDILKNDYQYDFKRYIFSFFDVQTKEHKHDLSSTPEELMLEAGYILFPECKTEEDIQNFKKYYTHDEELCTFWGGRLDSCRVWFAVKKDVDEIKRDDFKSPTRQDRYGTSVISIQFTKKASTLSIKNRYNHKVNNPDNTFDSNLDNIVKGLTDAFYNTYGVRDYINKEFEFKIKDYIRGSDGKFYHFNYEIKGVYYCDNNVIVDLRENENCNVFKLPADSQILVDYFIVDIKNKTIKLYDEKIKDCFVKMFGEIHNIKFQNNIITIKVKDGCDVLIYLDERRRIIALQNENLQTCEENFLVYNNCLKILNLPNLIRCGDAFLYNNKKLKELFLPKLIDCGDCFLMRNKVLKKLYMPCLTMCGDEFLSCNETLLELNLPKLKICGDNFLCNNEIIQVQKLPNLIMCGDGFFYNNALIRYLNLPNLKECGNDFIFNNKKLKEVNLPNLIKCSSTFLTKNQEIEVLDLPKLTVCKANFLSENIKLKKLNLSKLTSCGDQFLYCNQELKELNLPELTKCGCDFLYENECLEKLTLQNLDVCGDNFLYCNQKLKKINLPLLKECGEAFLFKNNSLSVLNLPNLVNCGYDFLFDNINLKKLSLPSLTKCGNNFLFNNKELKKINLPKLTKMGNNFLTSNQTFEKLRYKKNMTTRKMKNLNKFKDNDFGNQL